MPASRNSPRSPADDFARRFEAIFDMSLIGMAISGPDKRWYLVNDKLCDILGHSREELIGTTWLEYTHEEDRSHNVDLFNRALRGELDRYTLEKRFVRKDGRDVFCKLSARCLRGAQGQVEQFAVLIDDITQDHEQRKALETSEQRLELAVQATDLAIWDWDIVQDRLYFDKRFAEMLGYELHELPTQVCLWEEHNHPEEREWIQAEFVAHLEGKTDQFCVKHRMRTKSGQWKWILDQGKVVERDANNKPLRMTGTHQDIDAQHETEQRIRRLETELAHVSRINLMGEWMSGLAHEVNQPLYAVSNYMGALSNLVREPRPDGERIRALAAQASAEVHRAGNIIRTSMDFVRKTPQRRAKVELEELFSEVHALLKFDLRETSTTLETSVEENEMSVWGDRIPLEQVLINLIRNATQAMSERPHPRQILVHALREQDDVRIDVSDTGPGFNPDLLEDAFEPFMTEKPEGMGMGLAISRTIVQGHGGRIKAENLAPGGARVSVWLPVRQPPLPSSPEL